jgi:hypothetical protein
MKTAFRLIVFHLALWTFASCSTGERKQQTLSETKLESGETLAKKYCASCHLFPTPDLLDKKTWSDHALPAMGYRFGIYHDRTRDSLLEKGVGRRIVETANIFPTSQTITDAEWEAIKQYYITNAPEKLNSSADTTSFKNTTLFKSTTPSFKIERPAISALTYDEKKRLLYVADCSRENNSSITILNASFKPVTTLGLPHPVSNLTLRKDTLYILSMGHFVPSDEPAGQLLRAIKNSKGNYEGYQRILKDLKRPVDVAYGDLNDDGTDEIVVCEFGNHTGSVSLFTKEGRAYFKKVLLEVAGATNVTIEDMDNDNKKDIVVLMSQGDEGIDIYFNRGQQNFERRRVLRFPAIFGSSSFSLTDMNKDGHKDIIYTNGDNADASRILKPYHGIRIFLNDHHNSFTQSYFFPMHGAYKSLARDFDKDGDLDIAAISFFADYIHHPEQGFIYLENTSSPGHLTFTPTVVPESTSGRWITMLSADFNHDNTDDLLLGSFTSMALSGDSLNIRQKQLAEKSLPLLLLAGSRLSTAKSQRR